ncbi:hypothetical protein V7127_22645 [Bacillus sp. JJ1773]|uniref:hypothetical protein n=1 Tax=Bacillus sp. JJ1773 TaxID=3122965 RepID=UPI002FFF9FE6
MEVSHIEIGGFAAQAFKAIFGNPDVMVILLTWSIIVTLGLVTKKVYEDLSN